MEGVDLQQVMSDMCSRAVVIDVQQDFQQLLSNQHSLWALNQALLEATPSKSPHSQLSSLTKYTHACSKIVL